MDEEDAGLRSTPGVVGSCFGCVLVIEMDIDDVAVLLTGLVIGMFISFLILEAL